MKTDRFEARMEPARIRIESEADLPSELGDFRIVVFSNDCDAKEHLAMVHKEMLGAHDVVTRALLTKATRAGHCIDLDGDVVAGGIA